jgi:hypothetical protein
MTPERALEPRFGNATTALRTFAKESARAALRLVPRTHRQVAWVRRRRAAWAAVPRAILAFGLALGNAAPPATSPIAAFLEATSAFLDSAPWRHWDNEDVVDVAVTQAGRTKTYEGCIMGAGGIEFGLALYPEKGSIARLSHASMRDARAIDSIALTIDDEPDWAREALRDGFGIDGVPVPIRLAKRRAGRASAQDLATLAVVLRAVAALDPSVSESMATLDSDDGRSAFRTRPAPSVTANVGRRARRVSSPLCAACDSSIA